jgi:nitrite reductase/ring-hydroxylating ferredoxin subunit
MKLLASTADIKEGEYTTTSANGLDIIVGKADGRYFAVHDLCPHFFVPLNQGYLEDCQISCPWHGFTFDVHSGKCTSWEDSDGLETFPIEIKDGGIYLAE